MFEDNPTRQKEIIGIVFLVKVLAVVGSTLLAMKATKENCKGLAIFSWGCVAFSILMSFAEVQFGLEEEEEEDFEEEKSTCNCGCSCCTPISDLDDLDPADLED